MMRSVTDYVFANDDWLTARLIGLALLLLLVWRAIVLLAQAPPARPAAEPAASLPVATRTWFPSRIERLRAAVDEVKTKTDLTTSETASVHAKAELAQARAHLQQVLDELSRRDAPQLRPPIAPPATLALNDILQLLELAEVPDDVRTRLTQLIVARFDENRS